MRRLTLTNTLEYYDVPQILTATDATGTRYLCTLFKQTAEGYNYLGVQPALSLRKTIGNVAALLIDNQTKL